jgi:hypothetical protein
MSTESADPKGDRDGPPLTGDSAQRGFDGSDSHGETSHSPGTVETRAAPHPESDPRGDFGGDPIEARGTLTPGPPQSYAGAYHTPGTVDAPAASAMEQAIAPPSDQESS